MTSFDPLSEELTLACSLARQAGVLIRAVYATDFVVTEKGGGDGPVTEADRRANALIVGALKAAFPSDGIIAEESAERPDPSQITRLWWIDPLDGTRDFVRRTGDFAVHIGLAIEGEARLGVVYQPTTDRLWAGVVGAGARLEHAGKTTPLSLSDAVPEQRRLMVSRSHRPARADKAREMLGITELIERGSVGLKCAAIAAGEAELYVAPSPRSSRWDSCAPEAVLRAAGGLFTDLRGRPYRYDGSEIANRGGMFACHRALFDELLPKVRALHDDARERG